MKILVVDDDEVSLELLRNILTEKGHEVATARDGAEATSYLFNSTFRVVITDWMMPNMDGLALCRWIRSQGFPGYIFVIVLTARHQTADIIESLKAGADEVLFKPFDANELEFRIRTGERILSNEYQKVAIFGLAKLAESRDPETGRHLDRIREYSRLIGDCLAKQSMYTERLSHADIETIYQTSILHDIGKVGIPDAILLKPGPLVPAEFDVMKTHTVIGGRTLGQALAQYPDAKFLRIARDIAFWHHERYDGSGYPHALTGDDIPICARIVALADVYDALTSKRVYKLALSHAAAREIIVGKDGTHFDPAVVDAFKRVEEAFADVLTVLADTPPPQSAPAAEVVSSG